MGGPGESPHQLGLNRVAVKDAGQTLEQVLLLLCHRLQVRTDREERVGTLHCAGVQGVRSCIDAFTHSAYEIKKHFAHVLYR